MENEDNCSGPLGWRWTLVRSTNKSNIIYENVNEEETTSKIKMISGANQISALHCQVCEVQCPTRAALNKHVSSKHRPLQELRVKLKEVSPVKKDDHDSKREINEQENVPDKDRKRGSRINSESRTSKRVTQSSTQDEEGNEKHKYPQCEKSYSNKYNLRKHQRSVHLGIKYYCADCGKSFADSNTLKLHKESAHLGKRYACTDCPKIFHYREALVRHFRYHTGEVFSCSVCGKKYQQNFDLKRHIAKVHGDQETNESKPNDDDNDDIMIIEETSTVPTPSPDENKNKKAKPK